MKEKKIILQKKWKKLWSQWVEGLLSTGPTRSSFYRYLLSMVKIRKFVNKIKCCKKNLHIRRKTRYASSKLSVFQIKYFIISFILLLHWYQAFLKFGGFFTSCGKESMSEASNICAFSVKVLSMYLEYKAYISLFYCFQNTSKLAALLTQAVCRPNQYGVKVLEFFSGKSRLATLFQVIKGKHRFYNDGKHESFKIPFLVRKLAKIGLEYTKRFTIAIFGGRGYVF